MSFNAICENKILAKISGFTVTLSRPMEISIKLYTIKSKYADFTNWSLSNIKYGCFRPLGSDRIHLHPQGIEWERSGSVVDCLTQG